MTGRLDETLNALEGNSIALDLDVALELLDGWQTDLEGTDFEGSSDIVRVLGQLQAQLDSDDPDGSVISKLLADLANLAQDAADTAPDEVAGKLQMLSDILGDMSEEAGA